MWMTWQPKYPPTEGFPRGRNRMWIFEPDVPRGTNIVTQPIDISGIEVRQPLHPRRNPSASARLRPFLRSVSPSRPRTYDRIRRRDFTRGNR